MSTSQYPILAGIVCPYCKAPFATEVEVRPCLHVVHAEWSSGGNLVDDFYHHPDFHYEFVEEDSDLFVFPELELALSGYPGGFPIPYEIIEDVDDSEEEHPPARVSVVFSMEPSDLCETLANWRDPERHQRRWQQKREQEEQRKQAEQRKQERATRAAARAVSRPQRLAAQAAERAEGRAHLRARREALYAEHVPPTSRAFTLDDHLRILQQSRRQGRTYDDIAAELGVPREYIKLLMDTRPSRPA
jgi:hypothetical protein